ncbi:FAD dependent oxidoreductase [Sodiomyces alkalinus F11]|uniref:FAD dependent oxidoreductase n=1 Tax=Sodiomyces alkalinus (strain CBS 110278 / VKM F-3762 / F11) TaxID=1314773 RepID=A0A3N2Q790_SODAK|nr:FAD dependent oxidoreductase [Sodiomyces alkalinus F11]ROT42528.1 FAD dependent oxidoreductase [Sodiomyces alkalinus F11]
MPLIDIKYGTGDAELPVLRSLWQTPPADIAEFQSPELPAATDIVIVGSGITGAAAAWNLLSRVEPADQESHNAGLVNHATPQRVADQTHEPSRVVMLEAREACSGATGRNGGHTKAASYRSFLAHADALGSTEAACQIARMELANIRAVHSFARDHGIDCESRSCGTVDAIYDPDQWAHAHKAAEAMTKAMPGEDASRYAFHTPEELRERFHLGEGEVCGGVEYEAGSISAYRFTIGVLKLCLERGLNLQTFTPATRISAMEEADDEGHRWVVETPRGSIVAKEVVLATNGYTAAVEPRFQGVIVPLRGQITAHRPGSGMPKEGLQATYSFIYRDGYEYMVPKAERTSHAGDIVMGGGLVKAPDLGLDEYGTTDDSELNPIISHYLHGTTPRYFGSKWGKDHPDGRIRSEWTGIMGFSPDGFPFVGEMPARPGLWVSAGFQGHGMVLCWLCGKALTEMMAGRDGEELRAWFPSAFRVSEERLLRRFDGVQHTPVGSRTGPRHEMREE